MERIENASWRVLPALHRGKQSVPRTYINDVTNLSVPLFCVKKKKKQKTKKLVEP